MDMVGRLRETVFLQGVGSSSVWLGEIERRNVPVGLAVATNEDPYLPTDSTPFYMEGVPVLSAFTGAHEEYSTPRDTPDRINYDGVRDISTLVANIARSLALDESVPDYQEVERSAGGVGRSCQAKPLTSMLMPPCLATTFSHLAIAAMAFFHVLNSSSALP